MFLQNYIIVKEGEVPDLFIMVYFIFEVLHEL